MKKIQRLVRHAYLKSDQLIRSNDFNLENAVWAKIGSELFFSSFVLSLVDHLERVGVEELVERIRLHHWNDDRCRIFGTFQDSAQINGIEFKDELDGPKLPDEGLKSRDDNDAETIYLDQICKRESAEMYV